jgi:hypothetical protein
MVALTLQLQKITRVLDTFSCGLADEPTAVLYAAPSKSAWQGAQRMTASVISTDVPWAAYAACTLEGQVSTALMHCIDDDD